MPSHEPRTSNPRSDLERTAWPDVGPEFVAALEEVGTPRSYADGEVVFDVGQATYDFLYLCRGALDIVDRGSDQVVVRVEAGHFAGELGMLSGQGTFLAGVASGPVEALVVPAERLAELVATVPAVGDVVVPAFAARRRLLRDWSQGGLVLVGDPSDGATVPLLEFLERNLIPHRWIERSALEQDPSLLPGVEPPDERSFAVVGRREVIPDPDTRAIASALGLELRADTSPCYDVIVVGAGPAGLATAVYAASEGLRVLAVEDVAIGGQAGTSSRIENYLGFPTGISGAELAHQGAIQAFKFGARIALPRRATSLTRKGQDFTVALDDGCLVHGRSVVLALGVQYRSLPIEGLRELEGRGVYYAATDLEARFCRGQEAVVVGGGNSAGQAAMFLAEYAERVHLVVRGDGLAASMSAYLSGRIARHAAIELHTYTEVTQLRGGDGLEAVTLAGTRSGEARDVPAAAMFVMIGAEARTEWLAGQIALDEHGFVCTGPSIRPDASAYGTSLPGVFAVGDVRAGSVKRVASAVGEGSVVVSAIHRHLAATALSPAS